MRLSTAHCELVDLRQSTVWFFHAAIDWESGCNIDVLVDLLQELAVLAMVRELLKGSIECLM